MTEWLLLALSFCIMLIGGIFVAAEFSFITVDRATVERKAAAGDRGAIGTLKGLRTLSTQLSGAQLGITVTNLTIGWLAEPAIGQLLSDPLQNLGLSGAGLTTATYGIALFISTMVTMLVGELIPKNFALSLPEKTAALSQWPQRAFTKAMAWPIRILNGVANRTLLRMGVEPQEELSSARSPIELRSLVLRSALEGAIADETADLVARSIAFGDRTAADVRTPRVKVFFLTEKNTALDVIETVRKTGHSRFPVIGKSPDDIIGIVNVKHAVAVPPDRRRSVRLSEIVRPATTVPDTLELDPLLTLMRDNGQEIVVVVDEYGGNSGIVTLEDLVEEIVGDISDEHDRLSTTSRHRTDGTWSLSGLLRPDEVYEQTEISLPESDHYETIAGLVVAELGRLAKVGDQVKLVIEQVRDDEETGLVEVPVTLTVDRLDGRRVDRVVLTVGSDSPVNPEHFDGDEGASA